MSPKIRSSSSDGESSGRKFWNLSGSEDNEENPEHLQKSSYGFNVKTEPEPAQKFLILEPELYLNHQTESPVLVLLGPAYISCSFKWLRFC